MRLSYWVAFLLAIGSFAFTACSTPMAADPSPTSVDVEPSSQEPNPSPDATEPSEPNLADTPAASQGDQGSETPSLTDIDVDTLALGNVTAAEVRELAGQDAGEPDVSAWVNSWPLNNEQEGDTLLGSLKSTLPEDCIDWAFADAIGSSDAFMEASGVRGVAHSGVSWPEPTSPQQFKAQPLIFTTAILMDPGRPHQWVRNLKARPEACGVYTAVFEDGNTRSSDGLAELGPINELNIRTDEYREQGDVVTEVFEVEAANGLTIQQLVAYVPTRTVLFKCSFGGAPKLRKEVSDLCVSKAQALAEAQGLPAVKFSLNKGSRVEMNPELLDPIQVNSGA